ncbi:MAG: SulP family inorganic anion transporter [Pseudomonadota bacterium]
MLWLKQYRKELVAGDISAGVIVALMLIPQGMAYAMVAGLPPVTGLYASLLPAVAYALFGSSMVQSVGPMAITSLMVGTAIGALAPAGSPLYGVLSQQLALVAGVVLFLCGVLRLGFLSAFFSRPVMSGFTSGAAVVIAVGQLKPLLGLSALGWSSVSAIHVPSAAVGVAALLLLVLARYVLPPLLKPVGGWVADILPKLAPIFVIVGATVAVGMLGLDRAGVQTVGQIPAGLPAIGLLVSFEHWRSLLLPALVIGFMVFLASQSAAQTLAQKRGERIDTNRELLGLGAANLASAVSGGFVVTGSISRSAVNYAAGANTPLASLFSAGLIAVALCVPNAWLSLIPLPAMAATIVIAVLGMVDFSTLSESWRHDRSDAATLVATTAGVLVLGVEEGVLMGVVLSFASLIWRSSHPHIAIVGRLPGTEHFRNEARYTVETLPDVLMLRIDSDLVFNNTDGVISRIEHELLARPEVLHLVLVLSAVNMVDTTALLALNELNKHMREQKRCLHLCEVKGPVMDRLKHSKLLGKDLTGQVFLSAAQAYAYLSGEGDI